MSFPVRSTSTITPECAHFAFVVEQRSWPSRRRLIAAGGVFNCRHIVGSTSWSQHAWGNAIDLFAAFNKLDLIAENVVRQATRKTFANRGRLVPVHYIIVHHRVWTKERGWHPFTGTPHDTHVHVDFLPEREGRPPCAG